MAVAMMNVSSIAMSAETDSICSLKYPDPSATAASDTHATGCGVRTAASADDTSTAAPTTITAQTYACSARDVAGVGASGR